MHLAAPAVYYSVPNFSCLIGRTIAWFISARIFARDTRVAVGGARCNR